MVEDSGRSERRRLALTAIGVVTLLAVVAAVELLPWALDGVAPVDADGRTVLGSSGAARILAVGLLLLCGTIVASVVASSALVLLPVLDWPRRWRLALVASLSLMIGATRAAAVSFVLPVTPSAAFLLFETAFGTLEALAAAAVAFSYVGTRRRIRAQERRRLEEALHAQHVHAQLEREELRVRRELSRRLHGGLQQRLVLAIWDLETIRTDLESRGEASAAAALGRVSDALDAVRESEVRTVAHTLYPLAADIDLAAALRVLADRLPASVRLDVTYEGAAQALVAAGSLAQADRVILFSIVEEGVTNAVRHGRAVAIRVTLGAGRDATARRTTAHVTVDDDGRGFGTQAPELSGLARLQARVRGRGGELTIGPSPLGGVRLQAYLHIDGVLHDAEARS